MTLMPAPAPAKPVPPLLVSLRRAYGSCRALPVRLCEAALGDEPLQRKHRGVRRQDDELGTRGRQCEAAVDGPLERRLDLDPRFVEARVLAPERELGRAFARDDDGLQPLEQRLEVDVP